MARKLMKGNVAVVMGAILADCRAFFGYPITPASEITETAADLFPRLGRVFLQAESEVAAINMVYGAASTGTRTMTASSSPGISLKQEGISYCAGSELPCVIVDVVRGGPGLGNIAPEQADYFQMVKGGGHGNYRNIVLAPNCAQEMCDFTKLAFDLADKYRNPVVILTDGFIGQMMEPVELEYDPVTAPKKEWSVDGTSATQGNLVCSIQLAPEELEQHVYHLYEKYAKVEAAEIRFEEYLTEDAEIITVGYGVMSRILTSVVDEARRRGIKAGMIRPISLWPFPTEIIRKYADSDRVKEFFVGELAMGQMVEDVRLAVEGRKPVRQFHRVGGMVPDEAEVLEALMAPKGVAK
ncbi:MAG: 3-methyl-2-oxobutanoate dehydrogenase subunit VorB [Candidatus Eisenbacteria bacterium]|nr:3-methyl-2-oxobutanoate dehydrogenase subunit VorB [Candidatus Eisenbacteria bacterium]